MTVATPVINLPPPDPALAAAQAAQLSLANQSAVQANNAETAQIQSTLGDSTLNLARLFGANARGAQMSPLVGSTSGASK